jgi:hypothetical protein
MEDQNKSMMCVGTVVGHCHRHNLDVLESQGGLAIVAFNRNSFSRVINHLAVQAKCACVSMGVEFGLHATIWVGLLPSFPLPGCSGTNHLNVIRINQTMVP